MEFFDRLGDLVERRWCEAGWQLERFPAIAEGALAELPPSQHVSLADIVRWVGATTRMPFQDDLAQTFGQPPLRVFDGRRFHIECLFWLEGTTSIHDHKTSGAFHLLAGSSVHSLYRFAPAVRCGEDLELGELVFERCEYLTAGAIRTIVPGPAFIHALFHLDRPSISVVVRTPQDPVPARQFNYLPPGMAVSATPPVEPLASQLQLLSLLAGAGDERVDRAALRAIDRSSPLDAYHVLLRMTALTLREPARLEPLHRACRARHGDMLAAALQKAIEAASWSGAIVALRRRVRDPVLRFFLALLLNAPGREQIVQLVSARFPGREPGALVREWLAALAGDEDAGGLGLDFEPIHLEIMDLMMSGFTGTELADRLAGRFASDPDSDWRGDLLEQERLFRESLFRPLFVGGDPAPPLSHQPQ